MAAAPPKGVMTEQRQPDRHATALGVGPPFLTILAGQE